MELLKKYWPVVLFLIGVLVFVLLYVFVIRGSGKTEIPVDEEEEVAEIPFDQRPVVSLTPTEDGHYLNLVITNLKVDAERLEYDLLYTVETGVTQGVPGSFELAGKDSLEQDLLLGSESSGKFRYDEGVEEGTLTLRYRNDKGKLVGKLMTQFHLQNGVSEVTSLDGNFAYNLSDESEAWFVTMETFGVPSSAPGEVKAGPYGVFSSDDSVEGEVQIGGSAYWWSGSDWEEASGTSGVGIFVGI